MTVRSSPTSWRSCLPFGIVMADEAGGLKLHADKGYDTRKCHAELRRLRIKDRIVRRGEKAEKLGRYRWVVERTFAWLHSFRRLAIRYERLAVIHSAFLLLACSLLCAYNL